MTRETLRRWVRRAQGNGGLRSGVTTAEREWIRELERENRELRRANEILRAASLFFRSGARPETAQAVKFIAEHRERPGVEPIRRVLQFAPATYYAASTRPPSARAVRDQELTPQIQRVRQENFGVYGADKAWAQLRREGFLVARCTVERLMRELGLRGVVRGRTPRTTMAADGTDRPADPVDRHFVAAAPNRLWVADLTNVKTHSGSVYLAFIVDVFSRYVVGWQVSRSLRTDLALDALAESFNGLYKTELIRKDGPWRGLEDEEYATLEYLDWFNQRRLHTELGMVPPAEFEAAHYHEEAPASLAVSH